MQEVFIDLWKNAGKFREEVAGEATFVAMLARRRLIDRQRSRRRRPELQTLDDASAELPAPVSVAPLELADDVSRAKSCLEHLRQDERQVLELSIYHGLTQTGIATRTGLPLGTVKTHARRGLSQLRDCMGSAIGTKEGGAR